MQGSALPLWEAVAQVMVFTGCGGFKHGGEASGEHYQAEPGNEEKAEPGNEGKTEPGNEGIFFYFVKSVGLTPFPPLFPRPVFIEMAETMTKAHFFLYTFFLQP